MALKFSKEEIIKMRDDALSEKSCFENISKALVSLENEGVVVKTTNLIRLLSGKLDTGGKFLFFIKNSSTMCVKFTNSIGVYCYNLRFLEGKTIDIDGIMEWVAFIVLSINNKIDEYEKAIKYYERYADIEQKMEVAMDKYEKAFPSFLQRYVRCIN